jgi:tetratricopeptide (TPR) repeat protein
MLSYMQFWRKNNAPICRVSGNDEAVFCVSGLRNQLISCSYSAIHPESTSQANGLPASMDISTAQASILRGDAAELADNRNAARQAYLEAALIYRELLKRNSSDLVLWKNLGFSYRLSGLRDEAIEACKEAILLNPGDTEARKLLNRIQESNNQPPLLSDCRGINRYNPEEAQRHLDRGKAHIANKKLDDAIEELTEASRLNPADGKSHALSGKAWQRKGNLKNSIAEYRKSLALKLTDSARDNVQVSLDHLLEIEESNLSKKRDDWISKALKWRDAIDRHTPGEPDESAVMVGGWHTLNIRRRKHTGKVSHRQGYAMPSEAESK